MDSVGVIIPNQSNLEDVVVGQLNLANIFTTDQLNLKGVVISQLTLVGVLIDDQSNVVARSNSKRMFVVYQTLVPINGVVTSFTEQCDAKHNSIYQLGLYHEEVEMEYSS